MSEFWNAENTTTAVLTPELLRDTFDAMKRRDEEYRKAPKGPCGCPACVVHPEAMTRLETEGGWARCANCFNLFHIEAPHD